MTFNERFKNSDELVSRINLHESQVRERFNNIFDSSETENIIELAKTYKSCTDKDFALIYDKYDNTFTIIAKANKNIELIK